MIAREQQRRALEALSAADPVDAARLDTISDTETARRVRIEIDRKIQRGAAAGEKRAERRIRPAARLALLLVFAVGLTAVALTPPGKAMAERLAGLVGIGDEPTRESGSPIDEPAVVIGTGLTPNGTRYEVVASGDMNIIRDDPTTCISLDLAGSGVPTIAACLTTDHARILDRDAVNPTAVLGPEELGSDRLIVEGLASPEVTSAEIEHRTRSGAVETYPVDVTKLDRELASRIGASQEIGFVLSFLPDDLVPRDLVPRAASPAPPGPDRLAQLEDSAAAEALERITLVAYGSDGSELGRQSLGEDRHAAFALYGAADSVRDYAVDDVTLECMREVLPSYGTPGEIKPQLPDRFIRELRRCVKE